MTVERVKMHEGGPTFTRPIWGSMRGEEQFSSVSELADFLRFLLDQGVTTIDTAATYGSPHPYTLEKFLGQALAEVGREKFEIITKCGIQRLAPSRPENRIRHFDFTEKEIRRTVGESLANLRIDQADLILLHRPDFLMDPDETAGTLDALIAEGTTKHVGVSNFSVSRMELLASRLRAPIVTNQIEFSPVHPDPISDGTLDYAIREGHRPMIWSPVGGGKLLTSDDGRVAAIRNVLADIAQRIGLAGPAEAAICFVARHPAGCAPIIGSGKRERIEGAVKAMNLEMDRQDWYEIVTQSSPMLDL